jgi:dipeptide/tripeptide permease
VPRYAPGELRGTAYGLFYIVVGLSTLAGMTLVGYLWDTVGRVVAFEYSAVMGLIGAALLSALAARARRSRAPSSRP